jgi:hypothetical protein
MAGTPENNSDVVRYTRSDATTKSPCPTLLSIGAAQPAQWDIAAPLKQVKEVEATFRERVRIRQNRQSFRDTRAQLLASKGVPCKKISGPER